MSWLRLVERMLAELRESDPRREAYWAEQLAFGPVVVHALRLRLRSAPPTEAERHALGKAVLLARAALAALPDRQGIDPAALHLLARRQVRALSWGRRRCLARLAARLGTDAPEPSTVPSRMTRPYPLIGWRPDERLVG